MDADRRDRDRKTRWSLCIDLKSFYASVECVDRGLDPMTTNLVVADPSRSANTICLAVTPSMKALGVKNRCRLRDIPPQIDYITAPPRMQRYIDYAAEIYGIYLEYISKEDIHVYSIDEAFLDVTPYLARYQKTPKEMAVFLMEEVRQRLGIRATCGVGTNLYLTKIALDILAKHAEDFIAVLDEDTYREKLWDHKPLTDFWRIGRATAAHLAGMGIETMRQLAHADEELLYRRFGIDAELLIDHAWGREPVTIADIHAYKPQSRGLSSGQVLMRDYTPEEARIVVQEMTDQLCLDMTEKGLKAVSVSFWVGYSHAAAGRPCRGTVRLPHATNAAGLIVPGVLALYDERIDPAGRVRRIGIACSTPEDEGDAQLSFFGQTVGDTEQRSQAIQETVLKIKKKYGRNAMLKAMDLQEAATARERNEQIGGHRRGDD